MRGRLAALVLLAGGLAVAAAGGLLLYRSLTTAALVASGYAITGRDAGEPTLQAAIAGLAGRDGADAAAARMHLHYLAAWEMPDRLEWRRQLLAALAEGRQALTASPARADVALLLAEIEFDLFGAGSWVYQPLELSFRSAPREKWLIAHRIGLDLRLVAAAPPEIAGWIASDIRVLGEPFRSTDNYRVLAHAALLAGAPAIAAVRHELARGHPWPLKFFNEDLDKLAAAQAGAAAGAR